MRVPQLFTPEVTPPKTAYKSKIQNTTSATKQIIFNQNQTKSAQRKRPEGQNSSEDIVQPVPKTKQTILTWAKIQFQIQI